MSIYLKYREFIETWQMSKSIDEFCEKLGVDRGCARNIEAHMRRRNVNLKKFVRRTRPEPTYTQLTQEEWHMLRMTAATWSEAWKKEQRKG